MMIPLLLAVAAAAPPPSSPAGSIAIAVTNVRNARGIVHVDICPQARFLKDGCPWSGQAPAQAGTTIVLVRGVPPGHYAAQAFQDENRNGKVDRGLFGIPKEGVGFSNNAPIHFAPPKFAAAAFDHGRADQRIAFALRYF